MIAPVFICKNGGVVLFAAYVKVKIESRHAPKQMPQTMRLYETIGVAKNFLDIKNKENYCQRNGNNGKPHIQFVGSARVAFFYNNGKKDHGNNHAKHNVPANNRWRKEGKINVC